MDVTLPAGERGEPRARTFTQMPGFRHSRTWIFATMLFSACLSLVASFTLSYDAILLAANPDQQLACDISSVLSCGTVALSWQASLLGFPNAFLGMMCEPVVITIAVAGLAGVRFPRWFMFTAQAIYLQSAWQKVAGGKTGTAIDGGYVIGAAAPSSTANQLLIRAGLRHTF